MDFMPITVLLLVAYVTAGAALSCFQCNFNDAGCDVVRANDTNSPYYKTCAQHAHGTPILCRKFRVKIKDPDIPWRVYRSCGYKSNRDVRDLGDEDYCVESDSDFKKERSCECRADGCNSSPPATNLVSSVLSIVLPVAAVLLAGRK